MNTLFKIKSFYLAMEPVRLIGGRPESPNAE